MKFKKNSRINLQIYGNSEYCLYSKDIQWPDIHFITHYSANLSFWQVIIGMNKCSRKKYKNNNSVIQSSQSRAELILCILSACSLRITTVWGKIIQW